MLQYISLVQTCKITMSRFKILLVSDDTLTIHATKKLLLSCDYDCEAARTTAKALTALRNGICSFHAVLLDIKASDEVNFKLHARTAQNASTK